MRTERWQQVERLYHSASEKPAGERPAFLAAACAGDEELRREVESLLAHEDHAAAFIESPALEVAARMMAEEESATVVAGETIQQYRITSRLGAGGMGEVHLAEDTRLGRRVALKFLPAHLTRDPGQLRRFEQEARAVAALSHPNVCTIHEVIETADGRHCIVMEYVEGVTLRERMAAGRLEVGEALDVAIQVASALAAAHAVGMVHRDIKPENIMLRRDGYVKVLDFGLAKLSERQAADAGSAAGAMSLAETWIHTSPGMVMGTASYMSPEQARGLPVDARTDVWGLGVVLYEMVAGGRPFEGATMMDVMVAVVERQPVPLLSRAPEAPPQLERIVQRALAKNREERYPTAADVLVELKGLLHELTVASGVSAHREAVVRSRWSARSKAALAIAAAAVAIVAGFDIGGWRKHLMAGPPPAIRSIAVLPLENLSGDAGQEYFADGMTDALNGELAKIGALRVISRTSAMRYKGAPKPLPEIARELGVDAVVEGSVVRSGDRVRIRAQLIRAATDDHLWAEAYERDVRDILSVQSEVARAIAREIRIKTTPSEQARLAGTGPVRGMALDHYLQGLYHENRRTEEHLKKAVELFEGAIAEDPAFAPAYVELAECYLTLGTVNIGTMPPTEARSLGAAAVRKALEIDSDLADAHATLAKVLQYQWDWSGAEREFKRAIELNPSHASAHNSYAYLLAALGRAESALAEVGRAEELDPLSSPSVHRAYVLYMARRFDEAAEHYHKVIAAYPDSYFAHWHLGLVYTAESKYEEAIASLEKAVAISQRSPASLGSLGMVYALSGRKAEAHKLLDELIELSKHRYVPPTAFVHIYVGLGNKDQAFAWLERAYQERSYSMAYVRVMANLDPLRSDPRFAELVRRVGLAP